MNCQTARKHFSERYDRRLDARVNADFDAHLGSCSPCREDWCAYARIFAAVGRMEELPALRPFVKPAEAPGAPLLEMPRLSGWTRSRAAAAAALLLAVTHLAVFEFAREDQPSSLPTPVVASPGLAQSNVVTPTFVTQKLRDHVDAADVLARQIAHMPRDADEECRRLVSAHLELLRPEELLAELHAAPGPMQASARNYLLRWKSFDQQVEREFGLQGRGQTVERIQVQLEQSGLTEVMPSVLALVASEPRGRTWKELVIKERANQEREPDFPSDVKLFFRANTARLKADYPSAQAEFVNFTKVQAGSRLVPLARYMTADCLLKIGMYQEAFAELIESRILEQSMAQLRCQRVLTSDPLIGMFVFLREVPPSVTQFPIQLTSQPQWRFSSQGFRYTLFDAKSQRLDIEIYDQTGNQLGAERMIKVIPAPSAPAQDGLRRRAR